MKISKWNGLGNDFILVESQNCPDGDLGPLARRICDRHFGVGADGLVRIRPLGGNKFEMRIFNSDGSECEMCGNATRCVATYIRKRKLSSARELVLQTLAGTIRPIPQDNGTVRVDMGEPRLLRGQIPVTGDPDSEANAIEIDACQRMFTGTAVSMGNPHVVIFVPDIKQIDLECWGSAIENHPLFPQKVNVEFVEVLSSRLVRMRVWERGCGVTMACGTGSCATAVAGVITGRTEQQITVLLDGGELQIEYASADNHVYMTGPATEVFDGVYLEGF